MKNKVENFSYILYVAKKESISGSDSSGPSLGSSNSWSQSEIEKLLHLQFHILSLSNILFFTHTILVIFNTTAYWAAIDIDVKSSNYKGDYNLNYVWSGTAV